MDTYTISSFQDFTDKVAHMPFKALHRGQPKAYDTALLPKVARHKVSTDSRFDLLKVERQCLDLFRLHGMPYLEGTEDKWGVMAVRCHIGTRKNMRA